MCAVVTLLKCGTVLCRLYRSLHMLIFDFGLQFLWIQQLYCTLLVSAGSTKSAASLLGRTYWLVLEKQQVSLLMMCLLSLLHQPAGDWIHCLLAGSVLISDQWTDNLIGCTDHLCTWLTMPTAFFCQTRWCHPFPYSCSHSAALWDTVMGAGWLWPQPSAPLHQSSDCSLCCFALHDSTAKFRLRHKSANKCAQKWRKEVKLGCKRRKKVNLRMLKDILAWGGPHKCDIMKFNQISMSTCSFGRIRSIQSLWIMTFSWSWNIYKLIVIIFLQRSWGVAELWDVS